MCVGSSELSSSKRENVEYILKACRTFELATPSTSEFQQQISQRILFSATSGTRQNVSLCIPVTHHEHTHKALRLP